GDVRVVGWTQPARVWRVVAHVIQLAPPDYAQPELSLELSCEPVTPREVTPAPGAAGAAGRGRWPLRRCACRPGPSRRAPLPERPRSPVRARPRYAGWRR